MRKKWDIKLEVLGGLLALLWLAPFYLMFVNSFKSKKEIFMDTISLPAEWNFDNYITAFEELDFMRTLFNSLLITIVSVVLIIVFSAMAAYALSRAKSKLSTVLFLYSLQRC